MKKTRILSALLAVMMVISMIACITVPAVAEVGTLPTDAKKVTEVTAAESGAQNYKITEPSDFVYLSANYATITDTDDVLYIANDIDINDYEGGKEKFYADFVPITSMLGSIDGLGHIISNWYASGPIFKNTKQYDAYIKNLIFDAPVVNWETNASATGLLVGQLDGNGSSTRSITVENVHIKGADIKTAYGGYSGIMFGGMNTNNPKSVFIKNCSIINSSFTSPATYGVGILVGRIKSGAAFTIENVLVAGCTINGNNKSTEGGGLLVGDINKPSTVTAGTTMVSIKNVGLFNNTNQIPAEETAGTGAAIVANVYTATPVEIAGVYAAGNKIVSDAGTVPHAALTTSGKGVSIATISDYKVDSVSYERYVNPTYTNQENVAINASSVDTTYDFLKGLADLNASSAYDDWGFDAKGNATLLAEGEKAPVAVSFTKKDVTTAYYTDVNGKLVVTSDLKAATAEELAALGTASWSDGTNDVAKGTDWSAMTFAAAAAYTKTSHDLTYTAGENKTHSVVCDLCDEHAATGVACTPVADADNDVAATYFAKAKKAYKCEFCTNTWTEEVADSTYDAPYTVTFDKAEYRNNDTEVKVTVAPQADAKMSGMTLELTFPANYLTYVDADTTGDTVVVNESATGTLTIASVKANGTTLTAEDTIVLNFKVKGLSETVTAANLTVSATLTKTTVGTGNEMAVKEALTKTVSATAAASYLDFKAGDVNNDDEVDLLDAVLIIQKLNGTIGTAQNAAFKLIAADVNNSGDVNVADVTLVLQYVCEMEVTLTPATREPTIVVVVE